MKKTNTIIIGLITILLSGRIVPEEDYRNTVKELGSLKEEVTELRTALGEFQYASMEPQIKCSIKDVEFSPSENSYSSPVVKFKASLKQTNEKFPIENYSIVLHFSVLDENDNEIEDITIYSEIENGVLSLAEEESIYGLRKYNFEGHKLVVKNYEWYPTRKYLFRQS